MKKSRLCVLMMVICLGLGGCGTIDMGLCIGIMSLCSRAYQDLLQSTLAIPQDAETAEAAGQADSGPMQADDVFDVSEEFGDDQAFGGMAPGGENQFPYAGESSADDGSGQAAGQDEMEVPGGEGAMPLTPEGDVIEG